MNPIENRKIQLSGILKELHHRVETKERSRISQTEMASRLGISSRTYLEYLRGTNFPVGMRVVLDLLCMLDDEAISQLMKNWRKLNSPAKRINQASNIKTR